MEVSEHSDSAEGFLLMGKTRFRFGLKDLRDDWESSKCALSKRTSHAVLSKLLLYALHVFSCSSVVGDGSSLSIDS